MSAPDNYIGLSPLYCGRDAPPSALPLWAQGAPLNAWMEIPGTSGAGGTQVESYSGWAKLPSGKVAIALAGGHTDGTKNSVAVIDLLADAPAWVEVCPESPTHTYEVAYEADGKPTSCHTYYTLAYVPALSRLMRIGAYAVSLSGNTHFATVDGFNLSTNTWDAAGTYANVPTAGDLGVAINGAGQVLTQGANHLYNPTTGTATALTKNTYPPRAPWAWDSTRNQFYGLCFGDNQEASQVDGILSAKVVGTTVSAIAINASAAKTQFAADIPFYAAMEYDPINDYFLFYTGSRTGTAGRVYKITPNSTTTWDMSIFSYGSGSITPAQTVLSGIMNKFSYIPELKGFVMMPKKANNLYFMRTA